MNRIRYKKTENEGELASTKIFNNAEGNSFRIYLRGSVYSIVDFDDNRMVHEGEQKTPHEAKKAIKRVLEGLGVVFEKEKRVIIKESANIGDNGMKLDGN